ncbi:formylglycine-generating enzyme family protein [Konateibacter massiliensis]|uniref:formylglycine-generating enzyme family protein n=1 Tax=Konateibacter massiliensis TaxID=2002841 RepID=UPI000C15C294|nr:formylglycine-generating enzyme family protein [Konateibacter massiliensis]
MKHTRKRRIRKKHIVISGAICLACIVGASVFIYERKAENALPEEIRIELSAGVSMEFVLIEAGSFFMGSYEGEGDEDEQSRHKVTITEAFYIGKYEVTQKQWNLVMGDNPSHFEGTDNPVDTVSWTDSVAFTEKLSELAQRNITLPTEAQWEYACRSGSDTKWFFGASEESAGEYGWIDSNAQGTTHPVGLKKPNPWGVYDMYGNVQEWCLDWYADSYSGTASKDPQGAKDGASRIIRGGGWGDFPDNARSAYRNASGEEIENDGIGFRCVMY